MSKFDELKKLAEAATNGPWINGDDEDSDLCLVGPAFAHGLVCHPVVSLHDEANANFIAAANPAAVLELLAIQAQMVAALKAAKTWHNGEKWRDSSDPSEVRAWEQHRDIIAAALAVVEVKP